ncbi:phosphatase 2C-like domain-containing protein [Apodospora peruviana]|uniref:Protein phosphatase n=1 Tax=Apodospora peruviana TaxID=516989 RepID=A0AAE0MFI6_9PEZI|nr:phosphatase 2C-like domain-containing protein [Apodospora peruviana]
MRRLPRRLLASTPHATSRGIAPVIIPTARAAAAAVGPRPPGSRPLRWLRQSRQSSVQRQHQLHFLQQAHQRANFLTATTPLFDEFATSATAAPTTTSSSSSPVDKERTTTTDTERELFDPSTFPKLPYRFDTGTGLFAKRAPRPFPPPFLSPPSGSFSDPLSTHNRSRDRRQAYVDGHLIQGFTNGDDAVFASNYFICANDGVGAWSTRPRGHAGLWARLILHFWATAISEDATRQGGSYQPDPVAYLQRAYEQTVEATSAPNDWQGTTTAAGAQLHYRQKPDGSGEVEPLLYVTNLGDSQVMVVRPSTRKMVFKSTEQWHWFDCPRQLGTNSPDTPATCAVVDAVPILEGDIVLAMSDGVIDNLWSHEIVEKVSDCLERWQAGKVQGRGVRRGGDDESGMAYVAEELMEAAKVIALDPYAESPFMEHAIEEGLASEGGKLDDISVVAGLCRKNDYERC